MSAIGAIYHRDGQPVDRDQIERMARALAPYGPELQRARAYGEAGLACAIASFTKEDERQSQPVVGGDGRFSMVFDGRIDNREAVILALGLSREQAMRLSDAALAMRSYERWGVESFTKWIAEFALILWDETERQLLLARDPFGNRGLVYYAKDDLFAAATMPRGLHALPEIPRELDEQKLADALSQLLTDNTRTFFTDISSCPAGCFMVVDRTGMKEHRYYNLSDHVREIRYRRDDDYVEEAHHLLQEAVRSCLRSSGSIGAFMSGGLDSSTIAVLASNLLAPEGRRLPVFTWTPEPGWDGRTRPGAYGDETPYVRAIANQHPNIELNLVNSAGKPQFLQQDPYLLLSDMPVRHATLTHMFDAVLERARERKIGVMLTGASGNMTLSYTGDGLFYDLWRSHRLRPLFKELRALDRRPSAIVKNFYRYVASGMLSDDQWEWINQVRGRGEALEQRWRRYSGVHPEFGRRMHVVDRAHATGFNYFGRPRHARRWYWRWVVEQLFGGFSQWAPAMQALYGVEMRDPFNDRRFVEWCFGVPEEQFRRNGIDRWLVKRMMQGKLPNEVLYKKTSLGVINSDWHLRLTRDLEQIRASATAMSEDENLSKMIDIPRLQAMLDDWPSETVIDPNDPRGNFISVVIPMTMQVARFVQLTKGANR